MVLPARVEDAGHAEARAGRYERAVPAAVAVAVVECVQLLGAQLLYAEGGRFEIVDEIDGGEAEFAREALVAHLPCEVRRLDAAAHDRARDAEARARYLD